MNWNFTILPERNKRYSKESVACMGDGDIFLPNGGRCSGFEDLCGFLEKKFFSSERMELNAEEIAVNEGGGQKEKERKIIISRAASFLVSSVAVETG
ncbi:hypothetical protein CEXT_13281 [Caerostris extrusa]|uniref:Uncharacterized protein n=1 Tax=Caerostris extrusa TaxID=172846 RepID=A0AAV4P7D8_CAEEX|nr:hypothetical protein CEXT_13281 [Caerostris extrusa]